MLVALIGPQHIANQYALQSSTDHQLSSPQSQGTLILDGGNYSDGLGASTDSTERIYVLPFTSSLHDVLFKVPHIAKSLQIQNIIITCAKNRENHDAHTWEIIKSLSLDYSIIIALTHQHDEDAKQYCDVVENVY